MGRGKALTGRRFIWSPSQHRVRGDYNSACGCRNVISRQAVGRRRDCDESLRYFVGIAEIGAMVGGGAFAEPTLDVARCARSMKIAKKEIGKGLETDVG
jgi:hypothetical protein